MRKRVLSLLLVVFLMAGLCDIAVFAGDTSENQPVQTEGEAEERVIVEKEEATEEETVTGEGVTEKDRVTEKDEAVQRDIVAEDTEEIATDNSMVKKSSVRQKVVQKESTAQNVSARSASLTYKEFNTSNMYAIQNYGIKKNYNRALLLKVPGNKNGRVNPLIISPPDHSTGELYTFRKVYAWYTMAPLCASSYRVNVEGNTSVTDADVSLYTNTNHSTQGWYFEPAAGVADGYIIRSANNPDCVLDVRGTVSGTKVKIKKYEPGNLCQIWLVRAYTPSVSLNKTTATTYVGGTVTVSASKKPVNAAVSYSSSSTKIATVNSKGVITGKKAGTATIYAKCYGKTASCKVTVKKSSLSVGSKLQKTTITKGSTNGVSGTVKSNKKITKVYAQIIGKKNRKTYYSKTVKPKKTSYKLTGTIDNAMKFNKLGTGTYEFRVTAWDTSGNKVSKSINCTVKAKPKNLKNKTLGVPYYSQDDKAWNTVKIGNSSQYIGMVNGKSGSGCLLTDVAMIERYKRNNKSITPKTIARTSNQFSGANFRWDTGYGKNYVSTKTSLTNIYNQITAGKPVVASVYKAGEGQHWVVIYGYKNVKLNKSKNPTGLKFSNFLIRDPGWKNRTKLSTYSKIKVARVRK